MLITEHMVRAKHITPTKGFRGRFLELFTHRLSGVGHDIPRSRHAICWIMRPGRALKVVTRGEVFRRACAESSPAMLFLCGMLWHLDRIVDKILTAIDIIQKECVHEIADSHAKSFLA